MRNLLYLMNMFALAFGVQPTYETMFKILIVVLFSTGIVKAQTDMQLSDKEIKSDVERSFMLSSGLTYATYRDFATSPLFYEGPGLHFGLGWTWEADQWENTFETNFNLSVALAMAPESEYFQPVSTSVFINNQIYNSYLRKIDNLSFGDYTVKLGGTLMSDFNARINTDLQNAAGGIEALANLMLSGKLERNISRTTTVVQKFWFIKRTLRPVKRNVSFQLNTGILNLNWRPGYSYLSDSEFNGSDTSGLSYLLDSHSWSLNGWRLGTRLEYSKFRSNGNGMKLSYVWDAVHAPGKFESFQMASHSFRYTLIVNNSR